MFDCHNTPFVDKKDVLVKLNLNKNVLYLTTCKLGMLNYNKSRIAFTVYFSEYVYFTCALFEGAKALN